MALESLSHLACVTDARKGHVDRDDERLRLPEVDEDAGVSLTRENERREVLRREIEGLKNLGMSRKAKFLETRKSAGWMSTEGMTVRTTSWISMLLTTVICSE